MSACGRLERRAPTYHIPRFKDSVRLRELMRGLFCSCVDAQCGRVSDICCYVMPTHLSPFIQLPYSSKCCIHRHLPTISSPSVLLHRSTLDSSIATGLHRCLSGCQGFINRVTLVYGAPLPVEAVTGRCSGQMLPLAAPSCLLDIGLHPPADTADRVPTSTATHTAREVVKTESRVWECWS